MDTYTNFAVSKPTKHNWSSVYGYRPETAEKIKSLGEMFAVISLTSEIDFDLAPVGGLLLDELQSAYYGDESKPGGFDRFEQSLLKVKGRVEMILEREPELAKSGVDLELGLVVIRDKHMYGAMVGESRLFISRDGHTAEVGKSFMDPEADGFLRSGSLVLEANDGILLTTSDYAAQLKPAESDLMAKLKLPQDLKKTGAAVVIGYELAELPVDEPETVDDVEPVSVQKAAVPSVEVVDDSELEVETKVEENLLADEAGFDAPGQLQDEDGDDKLAIREQDDDSEYEDDIDEEDEDDEEVEEGRFASIFQSLKTNATGLGQRISTHGSGLISGLQQRVNKRKEVTLPNVSQYEEDEVPVSRVPMARGTMQGRAQDLLGKAQELGKQAADQVSYILKGRPGSRDMYVRGARSSNRWKTIVVVVAILAVVLFLVFRRRAEEAEIARQIQAVEQQVAQLDSQWQSLKAEVVTAAVGSPTAEQKQGFVAEIDAVVADAQELLPKNISKDKLEKILDETERSRNELLNIRTFSEPQLVTDLAVNFEGATPTSIVYSGGNLYVLDKAKNQIYRMGTSIRSEAATFVTGLVSPYLMTPNKDGDLVVVDNNEDSVLATVTVANGQVKRSPGVSRSRVGTLSALDVYDNNLALYSINAAKSAIFKQENVAGSYQIPNDALPWRSDSILANGVDIAVDFSIFTLVKGSGMKRFIGGEPATYNAAGFLPADATALGGATAFELTPTKLYIADPANRRVIVADRTDENTFTFAEQIVYDGDDEKVFTQITDISVNEAARNIFVLDGTRVIRLDM